MGWEWLGEAYLGVEYNVCAFDGLPKNTSTVSRSKI